MLVTSIHFLKQETQKEDLSLFLYGCSFFLSLTCLLTPWLPQSSSQSSKGKKEGEGHRDFECAVLVLSYDDCLLRTWHMGKLTPSLVGTFLNHLTRKTQEMHSSPLGVPWIYSVSLHRYALATGVPSPFKEVLLGIMQNDSRSSLSHLTHRKDPCKIRDIPSSINAVLRKLHHPHSLGLEISQARDVPKPWCPTSEELHATLMVL